MRKINKIANIALIFMLIGVFFCQDAYCLRVPMDIADGREQAALRKKSNDSKNLVLVSQVTTEKRADIILDFGFYSEVLQMGGHLCREEDNYDEWADKKASSNGEGKTVVMAFSVPNDWLSHDFEPAMKSLSKKAKVDSIPEELLERLRQENIIWRWPHPFLLEELFRRFLREGRLAHIPVEYIDIKKTLEYNLAIHGEEFLNTPLGKRLSPKVDEIIDILAKSINEYYDEVEALLKKENFDFDSRGLVCNTVGDTIMSVLAKYLGDIPEYRDKMIKIASSQKTINLENMVPMLVDYFDRFGKYFSMEQINVPVNSKFISGICVFMLADKANLPGGDEYKPNLPGMSLESLGLEELAIKNVKVDSLIPTPARANLKDRNIGHNLDNIQIYAELAWELMNKYPEPLSISEAIELLRRGSKKKLVNRVCAALYIKEFGEEAVKSSKADFIDKFIKVSRKDNGTHEIVHFALEEEYYLEKSGLFKEIRCEAKAFWYTLGYSGYPYFSMACIAEELLGEPGDPHEIAANILLNMIGDHLDIEPPEWIEENALPFFYLAHTPFMERKILVELGKREPKIELTSETLLKHDAASYAVSELLRRISCKLNEIRRFP